MHYFTKLSLRTSLDIECRLLKMTSEGETTTCEWCHKRNYSSVCSYCGARVCSKCTVETVNGEYYCKACYLSSVKSDQACD